MAPRTDKRHVAYRVGRPVLDPWSIFGTLTLVVFVFAFAFILWQARHALRATSHNPPTDRIVLVASPQPRSTPSSEPSPAPSPTGQLVDTGSTAAPAEPAPRASPVPISTPAPAPKPTPTHPPPTAIINVTPKAGLNALHVTADASFSWDATGIVSYQFNWGDGILDVPQASPVATHVYTVTGQWLITVTVVNRVGLSSLASTTVTVN